MEWQIYRFHPQIARVVVIPFQVICADVKSDDDLLRPDEEGSTQKLGKAIQRNRIALFPQISGWSEPKTGLAAVSQRADR
jgi:hypothetical protein